MGLAGKAAIVGAAQYKPEKYKTAKQMFHLEQVADLAHQALRDSGLEASDIDGLVVNGAQFHEAEVFVPAMAAEYLGIGVNFAEVVDLGGCTGVGMLWRAAAAIELGVCKAVLCVIPARMAPFAPNEDPAWLYEAMKYGGHSTRYGAPEAEFDLPYGHMGQNTGYAMIAQRYAAQYGYSPEAMAKLAVDQRTNALSNPDAIFYNQPLSISDVLESKMVADPLRVLEIVMPVAGGAAVIVASEELLERTNHRPAYIKGFGERLSFKSPSYAEDMTVTPVAEAAKKAFAMSGLKPSDIHAAQIYDCYTITVLLSLEDAGFCKKGEGMKFLMENDLTFNGNFPLNTHGGQLSFGQSGAAGGMSQIIEAFHQISGRAGARQLGTCDNVFVTGTGGVMSEQGAIVLQGGA
ncbi:thiolase family protein [Thalassotalea ponticola]|uniref:thiolase family protein n=1 Tax=Thalassotalea ponticola TaxID=1523392 RepID=UPI0025B60F19|nr:thiolase family protein [Thalassotalea ponticola]MDN3653823.1 thiolase family protein [Thalassotalea ponticola]